MNDDLPNFIVVGAAKAGTTAVHNYLDTHPQIFVPGKKELNFMISSHFDQIFLGPSDERIKKMAVKSISEYQKYFRYAGGFDVRGEVTPSYLYYYNIAIPNILKYLGRGVKIIIILRNPIDRAYSAYSHLVRDGEESLTFEESMKLEEERRNKKWRSIWYYIDQGMYFRQVDAYTKEFDSVKCLLYDDLKKDPIFFMQSLYDFLGVDSTYVPNNIMIKYNESGMAVNSVLNKFLNKGFVFRKEMKGIYDSIFGKESRMQIMGRMRKMNIKKLDKIPIYLRKELSDVFYSDIKNLEKLIDKDLSFWIEN